MTTQNQPWSFASPWGTGMIEAEVVSINSPDNSVQVRIHGYQDDKGRIPDEGLQWVKVLGSFAGIAGATGTHNLYPGAKVMLSGSGQQLFVMGSVTGYDSDQSKDKEGADNSDNKDPNTPRQVRGPKGQGTRQVPAGDGSDQTSKGTRKVTKTNKQFDVEEPQKIFEYAKQIAPFDFGKAAKFPDMMSIGIPKLVQGSNVLDTIDQMDGNVSGAIKASTKIIRSMQQSGFGDALSMMGSGANEGTAQVAQNFGNIQLQDLLQALLALMAAWRVVQALTPTSDPSVLSSVPGSLRYETFDVDQGIQDSVQSDVDAFAPSAGVARVSLIERLRGDFQAGFNQATANAMGYVTRLMGQYGTAGLVVGLNNSQDQVQQFVGAIQSMASSAGMGSQSLSNIAGGALSQVLNGGGIQQLMQAAQGQVAQLQSMMQNLNTFGSEINAVSEIMGGPASIKETLTGITMKFKKKIENFDAKGFTKG